MFRLRAFYNLSKPGIVRSNVLSAVAGYCFVGYAPVWSSLWWCMVGLGLVIASSCAANNLWERKTDALMARTKNRELPSGALQPREAAVFVVSSLVVGIGILLWHLTPIVALLALGLFISYVFVYTPAKAKTVWSTWLGTVPGSLSIVIGYVAAHGSLYSWDALFLFGAMAVWQMPHFYSIALFRRDDYKRARLPVHPNVFGARQTVRSIRFFSLLFPLFCVMLALWGSASWWFAGGMVTVSCFWIVRCFKPAAPLSVWGKKQFIASLVVLMVFCSTLILDGLSRSLF